MPLITPTLPAEVTAAFTDGLPKFLAGGQTNIRSVGAPPDIPSLQDVGAPDGGPAVHDPQACFTLGLQAAVGGDLTASNSVGWRLFAGEQQFRTVLGRVVSNDLAGWRLTAVFYDQPTAGWTRVWDLLTASHNLANLPEVQAADYELRILSIPALNQESFWLVGKTPGSDLVVPAAPNQLIRDLARAATITAADFLTAIAPLARERLRAPALAGW